jgi:type I restriction enzyme S subunit
MSSYTTYKSSGIEWLGDIPHHWEVKRLKLIGENIGGLTYSPDDVLEDESGTLVLRSSNIQNGKFSKKDNVFVDLEIPEKKKTYEGDILLCARNGSVALVGKNILINNETAGVSFGAFMSVFRSKSNKYIYWFFNSPIFSAQKGLFSTSTINQLTSGILYGMYSALPPKEEQTAIANYLDEKTSKLDLLISNKKKQIKKLKEIRQIEINTAVTKGLDSNVKLIPSGVKWLGDIPEHWDLMRIKNLSSLSGEKVFDYSNFDFFVALENIASWTGKFIESDNNFEEGGVLFNSNSVLFGKLRPYLAKAYRPERTGVCVSEILAINCESRLNRDFLFYRLLSDVFIDVINGSTFGAKMPRANWLFISSLKMPLPSVAEQTAIAYYLDEKIGKIDQFVSNLEDQIRQLQEIRKIEIYNAVTGKIRVA